MVWKTAQVMITLALLSGCGLQSMDRSTEGKKVIIFGGPVTQDFYDYFYENPNTTPISGVVAYFPLNGRSMRDHFADMSYGRYSEEDIQQRIKQWRPVSGKLPDSLLRLNVGNLTKEADWFDDNAWSIILERAKQLSVLVKESGMAGYCLDTELYGDWRSWTYSVQKHSKAISFEEYQQQVRKRGRELMAAFASAKSDVTILYTMAYAYASRELTGGLEPARGDFALVSAFIDGMMEAGPEAEFFDGHEASYGYKKYQEYADAARLIRQEGRKLSLVPELFDTKLKVSFGIWPVMGEEMELDEPLGFTPTELAHAVHYGLRESDGLVWLYTGWTYSPWWRVFPQEHMQAVAEAWKPHRLDFQPSEWKYTGPTWNTLSTANRPEAKDESAFLFLEKSHREVLNFPNQWKFKLDPEDVGGKEKWFKADHKAGSDGTIHSETEKDWSDIKIREWWQPQGFLASGIGWYRIYIDVPQIESTKGLILAFGAVDEEAWIWVNGEYAGEHAIGKLGWTQPFEIPVEKFIQPGKANQITVRVYDSEGMGGIWKGVKLMVPKE